MAGKGEDKGRGKAEAGGGGEGKDGSQKSSLQQGSRSSR